MAKKNYDLIIPQVIMERRCSVCSRWTEEGVVGHGGYIDIFKPSADTMSLGHRPVLYGKRRYTLRMYSKYRALRRKSTLAEREKYADLLARARVAKTGLSGKPFKA